MLITKKTKTWRQQACDSWLDQGLGSVYNDIIMSTCSSVWNHQRLHCLLNCWFMRRSKKMSKLRVTGLCMGNSSVTGKFPTQKASNVENVSIRWHHHGKNSGVYPMKYVQGFVVVMMSAFSGLLGFIYPYPSGLHHWHWGNHMIAPVPVMWPWKIWVKSNNYLATKMQQSANDVHNSWDILYDYLYD